MELFWDVLIIFIPCDFSRQGLWVTASVLDSFEYSSLSQQYSSLNGYDSSSGFQLFSYSFQSFGTVPRAPTTIGIIMFHNFFSSQARSKYLFISSLSFIFSFIFCSFQSFIASLPKPSMREGSDVMYSVYLFFAASFGWYSPLKLTVLS